MLKMLQNKVGIKKIDIFSVLSILFCFGLDRLSKIFIINLIQSNQGEIYINDYLNFTLNWNTGIAFGLLSSNANIFYHTVSALILLIIVYLIYLMVKSDNFVKISLSLVIGGAFGNLYDRLNYFAVPDFVDFHIKEFHWFTFNIADIFITVGIILILIYEIFFKNKISKND